MNHEAPSLLCVQCHARPWTVDFGHGRLCGACDRERHVGHAGRGAQAAIPLPTHQPAPHWQDDHEEPPF